MTTLLAPGPFQSFTVGGTLAVGGGATFTSDANSLIFGATSTQITDLVKEGCVPIPVSPTANFRNLLDGGDATINPAQRNTAAYATSNQNTTDVTNTPTYFMDRWFGVGGASSAIKMGPVADTSVPGFSLWHSLQRKAANANTAAIFYGQVLETADVIRVQGETVTLSFWAKAGANFSGGPLSVKVFSGTGTNDTAANMVAGSWAGSATPLSATQAITAGPQRYSFTFVVPLNATQLGVLIGYTPVGTAGTSDLVLLNGMQLEIGATPGPFEYRDVQVELEICQRYAWVIPEPANGVIVGVGGAVAAANNQVFYIATPVQFYKAPTVSVVAGSFKVAAAASAAAATGMAGGSTHTPGAISIVSTLTQTVGLSATLQGGGGSGAILASADF